MSINNFKLFVNVLICFNLQILIFLVRISHTKLETGLRRQQSKMGKQYVLFSLASLLFVPLQQGRLLEGLMFECGLSPMRLSFRLVTQELLSLC